MSENNMKRKMRIYNYELLHTSKDDILHDFHTKGYIAVSNVPNFEKTYQTFIKTARTFIALSETQKAMECTPKDSYARGWSRGIEVFNKKRDTHKGSYYASFPENPLHPNIWPKEESVPGFQECYTNVANIINKVGAEVLKVMLTPSVIETCCVTRMLHYSAVLDANDDDNPNWCGIHKDHGLFTGLGPEIYFLDDKLVEKPNDSGLFVLDEEVSPPLDVLIFQIGEALELTTHGKTTATQHFVKKAIGGYERFSFAVFFQPVDFDMILNCTQNEVVDKYADRFTAGMTYKEWNERSLERYNPEHYNI